MNPHPACWARPTAKIPLGITVTPGTRLARISAYTSAAGRPSRRAKPLARFRSARWQARTITPRPIRVSSPESGQVVMNRSPSL